MSVYSGMPEPQAAPSHPPLIVGKILVVIASYGTNNDQYLARLIHEYQSMPYAVDIVVCSNIFKDLGPGVEVIVGLPDADPRSLPFAPRSVLASRLSKYDLFIYSEDDTLITSRNIEAFCRTAPMLTEHEVPGFLRFEKDLSGGVYYPDVHHRYHWDPKSVKRAEDHMFAFFTNEHAACYVLTHSQLTAVIRSGGFLVAPHEGKYDKLETAATDPYTQCGLRKMICISHIDDFVVHHLPNKYIGKLGVHAREVHLQVAALTSVTNIETVPLSLFDTVPDRLSLALSKDFAKNYYEPVRPEVVSLIEKRARSVLSIGCGWGAIEECLCRKGIEVVAVPVDSVIAACVRTRGVRVAVGDLHAVREQLRGETFECLLLSNVLHLIPNPPEFLGRLSEFLEPKATIVTVEPNLYEMRALRRWVREHGYLTDAKYFETVGIHRTSQHMLKGWLRDSGFIIDKIVNVVPDRARTVSKATYGIMDFFLASEFIALGTTA
jgi:2-polyprenyl-3-methyl-5-hydroxy-6-metoxy-1,4-benzoquinol methylase